jgi:uncharacterized protein
MKKFTCLLILSSVLLLGCADPEIPSHRLIENGGISFEIGSNSPFNGIANEYRDAKLHSLSYFKEGFLYKKETFYSNALLRSVEVISDAGLTTISLFSEEGIDITDQEHKTFWDNGVLKTSFQYSKGLKDGLWEDFNMDGVSVRRSLWRNGILLEPLKFGLFKLRDGLPYLGGDTKPYSGLIEFDVDQENFKGKLIHQFNDGRPEGISDQYYENGNLRLFSTIKSGPLFDFSPDKLEITYENDPDYYQLRSGTYGFNYEAGTPNRVCDVAVLDKKATDVCRMFYENGQLKSMATNIYLLDDNNRQIKPPTPYRDGEVTSFYESGAPHSIKKYDMGKPTGEWIAFAEDGTDISNGEQRGSEIAWYMPKSGFYREGKKHGKWTDEDASFDTYVNGSREGDSVDYLYEGCLWKSGKYKNDKKDGEWQEYKSCSPTKTVFYKNGEIQEK